MRNYAGSAVMLVVTMIAAVGCYTINLKVSSERASVESLRTQLVADAREMRNLQAELRTRARFPELQRWNDNVLHMSAPAAGQFLRSPVQLASYAAAPSAAKPGLVYTVTMPAPPAPMTAPLQRASYDAAPAGEARLIRAGYTVARREPVPVVEMAAPEPRNETPRRVPIPAVARPERVQTANADARPVVTARRAAPAKLASPRVDVASPAPAAPVVGAPVDLLPKGGQ